MGREVGDMIGRVKKEREGNDEKGNGKKIKRRFETNMRYTKAIYKCIITPSRMNIENTTLC